MKSMRYTGACIAALAATTVFAQQTYNPPTMTFHRGAHNQWGKPGEFGLLTWSDHTDRADHDFNLGAFAPDPIPKTGIGLVINLNGTLGVEIDVWGKNGELEVSYPANLSLTYPDPKTVRPGDVFSVGSSFYRDGSGSMNSTAADYGFSLAGLIQFGINITAGIWFLGGDPVAGTTVYSNDFPEAKVGIFNTDLPGFKEYVALNAGHYELFGGIVEGEWGFPHVTTSGGNGPGNSLTSHGSDDFLTANVSITDAILAVLGLPIDLNGTGGWPDESWGHLTYEFHLLDLQFIASLAMVQDFTFNPNPVVELAFSDGSVKKFHAGESVNVTMPTPAPGAPTNNWTISPTFSMEGTVNNHSKLELTLALDFDPFVFNASWDFIDVWSDSVNWKLVDTIHIWDTTLHLDLVDKTFDMKGFNRITTTPFTVEGFKYPAPTIGVLNPVYVNQGSGALVLNVKGSNFVPDYTNGAGTVKGTTVTLGGSDRTTTYVSVGEVNAAIPATDTATEGRKAIRVRNPSPGGGTSNSLDFIVD